MGNGFVAASLVRTARVIGRVLFALLPAGILAATLLPFREEASTLLLAPKTTMTVMHRAPAKSSVSPPLSPAPVNDACASAPVISSVPFTDTVDTTAATTDPSDPIPPCKARPSKSVWYHFTAPRPGVIIADTTDSSYDTILSTYTGSCANLSPVSEACNDDDPFDGAQSRVQFQTPGNRTFQFMISAYDNDGGTLHFRLRFFGTPTSMTPTPTPTPTRPPLLGDANCDGRVRVADVSALIRLIAATARAECRLDDVTQDGFLDEADIDTLIRAIFEQ